MKKIQVEIGLGKSPNRPRQVYSPLQRSGVLANSNLCSPKEPHDILGVYGVEIGDLSQPIWLLPAEHKLQ